MCEANTFVPKVSLKPEHFDAIVEVLSRLGDKWTILIVSELADGPLRYGELQRRIGVISQRMLTLTLKGLSDSGLVSRTVFPTIPPRVDYELTELGFGLRTSLQPFCEWALQNLDLVTARKTRKVRKPQPDHKGKPVRPKKLLRA